MRYLVTGCNGFIGSYFVKFVLKNDPEAVVVGLNRASSMKNEMRLEWAHSHPRFDLHYADLSRDPLADALQDVECVVNFAAKTFVDYSIRDPQPFIDSNIVGTYRLLEEVRKSRSIKHFFQVSTDEVYGAILNGAYKENSGLNPTNPYSAAKAAGDMMVVSYFNTYGIPAIITRTENNYGPFQGREKAVPTFVRKALADELLPVYGDGKHRRMWLYVEDHVTAILHLMAKGQKGQIYHVAGEQETENIELAKFILKTLGKPEEQFKLIPDHDIRPGHDRRYALNADKIRATGWTAKFPFELGMKMAVEWYRANQDWMR
ncbi:GDP-mannose 4,6-dehydratase [uncultured archaeon]|nr:GDP-mannose 4,6-dehydratase [uncultured archaeon]